MKPLCVAVLFCLAAGDPSVTGAVKKLGEKKSYAFTVATKFEGDAMPGGRALEQPVAGAWEKGETLTAKIGRDGAELARKGVKSAYKIGDDTWRTAEEIRKEAQSQAQQQGRNQELAILARLESVLSAHAEWVKAMSKVAGLAKQKELEDGNLVWTAPLTKDAAKDAIEEIIDIQNGNGGGGGNPVNRNGQVGGMGGGGGGGGGGFNRGGGNEVKVKEAAGTIKFLVGKEDELPHGMVTTVTAKLVRQQDGKPVESEVTMTRTITFQEFDAAKVVIPDGAKKKLP